MENNNKLSFTYHGFSCLSIPNNDQKIIRGIIKNARVGNYLKFNSLINITGTETSNNPDIKLIEKWSKKLCNGLLFDVENSQYNQCYVYRSCFTKGNDEYSFTLYNTETDSTLTKSMIADSINELVISLGLTVIR